MPENFREFRELLMKQRIYGLLIIVVVLALSGAAAQAQRKKAKANLMDVNIYAAQELEDESKYDSRNPSNLLPVKRRVDAKSPLRGALVALPRGLTPAEERKGFVSVMFGIKFLSVRLENGTAYAYFTMPEDASFAGDLSAVVFKDAVERTALQFPNVKRVEVCLDGILNFWDESDEEPKKCSK